MKNILNRIIVRDQNCIITGATGNLGKSISFTLAEMGFNLILTDKNLNQLKSLKKEISLNFELLNSLSFLKSTNGNFRFLAVLITLYVSRK